jgi:hypothetical protein
MVLVSAVVLFFEEKYTPPSGSRTSVPVPVPDTRHLYRYVTGIASRTIRADSCGSGGEMFFERKQLCRSWRHECLIELMVLFIVYVVLHVSVCLKCV